MCRLTALSIALATAQLFVAFASGSAAELGDPTRPPRSVAARAAKSPPEELRLRAVVIEGERRFAVVGTRKVSVGDRIAGGRVVEIDLASVRLSRGGREVVLRLAGRREFKRPASGSRRGGGAR